MESSASYRFDGLHKATGYLLELLATYTDPVTGATVTETIATTDAWTMPDFSQSVVVSEDVSSFTISMAFNDPSDAIGSISWYVYVEADGWWQYDDGGSADLLVDGNAKTGSLVVAKPSEPYRIVVYVNKRPTAEASYSCILADIIRGTE
jgi:hypothetical protein